MRRAASILLISCAAFVGACGGSEEPAPEATESTPAPAEATVAEGAVRVAMKDIKFVPENVEVEVGQTVTWVNEDAVQHDAVATEGESGPKSELFNQGESYSWTAEEKGTIPYVCTVHPGMEGTITVR